MPMAGAFPRSRISAPLRVSRSRHEPVREFNDAPYPGQPIAICVRCSPGFLVGPAFRESAEWLGLLGRPGGKDFSRDAHGTAGTGKAWRMTDVLQGRSTGPRRPGSRLAAVAALAAAVGRTGRAGRAPRPHADFDSRVLTESQQGCPRRQLPAPGGRLRSAVRCCGGTGASSLTRRQP